MNNIDLILIGLMDSSHFTYPLWSDEHVMNPNIKEVIDIFPAIFGYVDSLFYLDLKETAGLAVKA